MVCNRSQKYGFLSVHSNEPRVPSFLLFSPQMGYSCYSPFLPIEQTQAAPQAFHKATIFPALGIHPSLMNILVKSSLSTQGYLFFFSGVFLLLFLKLENRFFVQYILIALPLPSFSQILLTSPHTQIHTLSFLGFIKM